MLTVVIKMFYITRYHRPKVSPHIVKVFPNLRFALFFLGFIKQFASPTCNVMDAKFYLFMLNYNAVNLSDAFRIRTFTKRSQVHENFEMVTVNFIVFFKFDFSVYFMTLVLF